MSIKAQVRTGVKWTTLSTVVLAVVGLLKISILTRFLEKSDFGLMALITFVLGFMELFNDMGLSSAILHKQDITKKEYASVYWLNIFVSIGIYSLLFIIAPLAASFYKQPLLKSLIPLLGLNIIFSGIGRQFKVREQKQLSFKAISLIDILTAVVSLLIAIYLAVRGYGIYSLIISVLFQFASSNTLFLIRGLRKERILFHYKFSETKPFLKIGIYQVGGQVINYFNRDLDILIIGKIFPSEILGGYSLAKQLVTKPMQILNPIVSKVATPTLAIFQNNIQELKDNYLKLINILSSINIPAYILLGIFAPLVVNILYGSNFENIVIIVRILSIYMIFRSVSSPVGSLVVATGRTDIEFFWNTFALLVTPLFILLGSNMGLGATGSAIGLTLSMLVLFIPAWKLMIHRMTGASLREYLKAVFILDFKQFRQNKTI